MIAILFFGVLVIYMTSYISKSQAEFATQYSSYFIANTMNSEYFLEQMGIDGLEELDPNSPVVRDWIDSIKITKDNGGLPMDDAPEDIHMVMHLPQGREFDINLGKHGDLEDGFPFLQPGDMVQVNITLNGREIYMSPNWGNESTPINIPDSSRNSSLKTKLLDYFVTESVYPLFDSKGYVIGSVTARIDSGYVLTLYISMVVIIGFLALVCLFAANLVSKFLTISITKPLNQLEDKIKAIASGDYKATVNAQIVLKKPLKEIESLAGYTNEIMHKMKGYSELLESQKTMLENQNEELEAQNEELIQSRNQVEETRALLVQSEKMASIGQLTAAITHEINTPLGAINSNVQLNTMLINLLLSSNTISTDNELSELISQMKEANDVSVMACDRVIQIIRSLKTFSKLDQAEFQEADINEGLKSVLILTSNLWKRKITIHEEYGNIPPVKCYSSLLNQVFMNIIVNAIQSIEDKGEIYIKTHSDSGFVNVSIKDTGCGIKAEHMHHIFDVGYSTKGNGLGAGLGLSISSNIIKKHNGEISVYSEDGKGSEFVVRIPLAPGTHA